MQLRAWVGGVGLRLADMDALWWYQVQAYGLNSWYGGISGCPFCQAAGGTELVNLQIRPNQFGICHQSVLHASHIKVHNALVALVGGKVQLGALSDAFMHRTTRNHSKRC